MTKYNKVDFTQLPPLTIDKLENRLNLNCLNVLADLLSKHYFQYIEFLFLFYPNYFRLNCFQLKNVGIPVW